MPADPLELDAETMRRMGHEVVDRLVERIATVREQPVLQVGTRADLARRLDGPAPEAGRSFPELLDQLERDVLPFAGSFAHPRFFGYIPGAGTWPGALGDLIAAALNVDAGEWREASGASQLELTVLDWFRSWIGYPPEAAGVLVSGGSAANITAIACAREAVVGAMTPRIVMYTSDQSHSSIPRAARHLGFGPDQVRVIATDEAFRMRVDDLRSAMDEDVRSDRIPFLVAAVAGSTNTGAVDDLPELASVCRARGAWLHVDGAYGAFAVLTERGRAAMPGLDLADSVTLDPHKWLAMPFEVGCLLVRHGDLLEHAFELHPEYLKEGMERAGVNFADRGLQLTRISRAIKVWLSLSTFGVKAFRTAIDRAIDQALLAEQLIRDDPGFELVTPASLGIVSFRRRPTKDLAPGAVDRANAAIVSAIAERGDVLVTGTTIHGRYAIRLCALNHTSTDDDVRYAIERVAGEPWPADTGPAAAGTSTRDGGIDVEWLRSVSVDAAMLREIRAFSTVTDAQAARFLGSARERGFEPGEHITERWTFARTFDVVLDGRLSVRQGERELAVLGASDFLGEIAAIDWGRDFSYGRTATVVALEPTRVLEFPASALRDLMAEAPEVDREIRRIAQERLARR